MEDMTWESEKCNVALNFWCEKEGKGEMKENKKGKGGRRRKERKYNRSLSFPLSLLQELDVHSFMSHWKGKIKLGNCHCVLLQPLSVFKKFQNI